MIKEVFYQCFFFTISYAFCHSFLPKIYNLFCLLTSFLDPKLFYLTFKISLLYPLMASESDIANLVGELADLVIVTTASINKPSQIGPHFVYVRFVCELVYSVLGFTIRLHILSQTITCSSLFCV